MAALPEHPLPRYRLAVVLAGSGRGPEALDALAGAVAAGLASAEELEAEPAFDRLRRDPRLLAAVKGVRRNRSGDASGGGAGAWRGRPREEPDPGPDLLGGQPRVVEQQLLVPRRVVSRERQRLHGHPERACPGRQLGG